MCSKAIKGSAHSEDLKNDAINAEFDAIYNEESGAEDEDDDSAMSVNQEMDAKETNTSPMGAQNVSEKNTKAGPWPIVRPDLSGGDYFVDVSPRKGEHCPPESRGLAFKGVDLSGPLYEDAPMAGSVNTEPVVEEVETLGQEQNAQGFSDVKRSIHGVNSYFTHDVYWGQPQMLFRQHKSKGPCRGKHGSPWWKAFQESLGNQRCFTQKTTEEETLGPVGPVGDEGACGTKVQSAVAYKESSHNAHDRNTVDALYMKGLWSPEAYKEALKGAAHVVSNPVTERVADRGNGSGVGSLPQESEITAKQKQRMKKLKVGSKKGLRIIGVNRKFKQSFRGDRHAHSKAVKNGFPLLVPNISDTMQRVASAAMTSMAFKRREETPNNQRVGINTGQGADQSRWSNAHVVQEDCSRIGMQEPARQGDNPPYYRESKGAQDFRWERREHVSPIATRLGATYSNASPNSKETPVRSFTGRVSEECLNASVQIDGLFAAPESSMYKSNVSYDNGHAEVRTGSKGLRTWQYVFPGL